MATGFIATTVHIEFLLKVAGRSIFSNKIPQRGATTLNGAHENRFDFFNQFLVSRQADARCQSIWPDTRRVKCFVRVDITYTNNNLTVHDEQLHRHLSLARQVIEVSGIKFAGQWFGSQVVQ